MTERSNRFIFGFSLLAFLFLEWSYGVFAILFILLFEGITNWRIPLIISRFQYATDGTDIALEENKNYNFDYEAERVLRLALVIIICLGFIIFKEILWFIPFCIGLNLLLAGITGICPLLMLFRKIGFR